MLTKFFFATTLVIAQLSTSAAQLVIPDAAINFNPDQMALNPNEPTVNYDEFVRAPTLSDVLALESQASIFYSYARESAKYSGIFSGVEQNEDAKFTVFVPTNKAVMALSRKPHEGRPKPIDLPIGITEKDADRESLRNVERWVSAHIVQDDLSNPQTLIGTHSTLNKYKSITVKDLGTEKAPEWTNYVLEPGMAIINKREAANGVLYLIDGTIEV